MEKDLLVVGQGLDEAEPVGAKKIKNKETMRGLLWQPCFKADIFCLRSRFCFSFSAWKFFRQIFVKHLVQKKLKFQILFYLFFNNKVIFQS